ncbi:MAG: stage 0 sporulation family protein [Lawsonibacter sp.]|jgi:cell fate regulator YaaT (PSP1 superfamily)|nr:stage 0 sporulation family protein [Lawsonibacter sp.]
MVEIISVRFKNGGKEYYFNPNGAQFQVGDGVIVETTRGTEYAQCIRGNTMIDEIELTAPLRPVVRAATPEDAKTVERNKEREKRAMSICQQKIAEHGLDMKLVSAEYSFDGSKILFFFTSEGRVDFRALVKDLAGALHARIELRQIGVRDEAKLLGGLGICGKPFCCSQFLDEFQPVSIKMAKTQNLSLNPTKISGTCGRLMCCLKFEQEAYEDLVKRAPKQESFVETPDGAGTVCGINLLRQTAQVRLESDPDSPRSYHNCELCVVRSGKGKRPEGYVEPPLEELAKLRRQDDSAAPVTEEASLAAAIEAAFPSRERREDSSGEEHRPNSRRNRGHRPRGGEQRPQELAEARGEESGEAAHRPGANRRRRRRPNRGGGKGQG